MASANLEDTESEDEHRHVELERSRSVTPSARIELLLENVLGKLTEMEDRLSNQQTVLAKETVLALQKLEEGQVNLVYSQTAQTAEVAEIVHRLNTLERSRASSRVSSRVASPDPYLSGTATQVPGLSAGALFPQDHLVNRSVNPNSTTAAPIFSTSVCEGLDTLSLGPRRSARLQSKPRPDYRHIGQWDDWSGTQTRVKEVYEGPDRHL